MGMGGGGGWGCSNPRCPPPLSSFLRGKGWQEKKILYFDFLVLSFCYNNEDVTKTVET